MPSRGRPGCKGIGCMDAGAGHSAGRIVFALRRTASTVLLVFGGGTIAGIAMVATIAGLTGGSIDQLAAAGLLAGGAVFLVAGFFLGGVEALEEAEEETNFGELERGELEAAPILPPDIPYVTERGEFGALPRRFMSSGGKQANKEGERENERAF